MARLIDGFEQFFDAAGNPLVNGKLYFYESGSGTVLKNTYADSAETIPNTNPVILNGDGRCTNVFGTGSYRVVLTDTDSVQLVQRDPIGGVSGVTFGADWNSAQIYGANDVVRDAGEYWISQIADNQNIQPSTDLTGSWKGWLTFTDITELSVAAGSTGNVSRWVMSTTTATATQYANLATIAFPATNNVAANITLLLTPKSVAGQYSPVLVAITALQGTAGLSTSSRIEVLSSDETAIARDDLFLDTATAANGTDVLLWMQSIIAAAYDVQVIAESFDTGVSVSAYNDAATWTASAPAGAVTITSDWAGSGQQSSTSLLNGWGGTIFYRKDSDGIVTVSATLTTIGTTAAGTNIFTLPAGYRTFSSDTITVPLCGNDTALGASAGRIQFSNIGTCVINNYAGTNTQIRFSVTYKGEN